MRIDWWRLAYNDALDIADYINIDNPVAALAVYEEIIWLYRNSRGMPKIRPHI